MRFAITLLSFPMLIWAWFQFPFLNAFDWKWLLAAFFLYCYALIKILDHAVEHSSRDFAGGRSSSGGSTGGYGDFGGGGGFSDGCDGGGGGGGE